jgi:hypothetical protein
MFLDSFASWKLLLESLHQNVQCLSQSTLFEKISAMSMEASEVDAMCSALKKLGAKAFWKLFRQLRTGSRPNKRTTMLALLLAYGKFTKSESLPPGFQFTPSFPGSRKPVLVVDGSFLIVSEDLSKEKLKRDAQVQETVESIFVSELVDFQVGFKMV